MKTVIVFFSVIVLVNCQLDVKNYLLKYGYLPSRSDESYSEKDIYEAIRKYQRTFRLKETGIIDEDTLKLMERPRCGVKDYGRGDALYDNGWSKTNLTYYYFNYTPDLPRATVQALTARALKYWSDVSALSFKRVGHGGDIVVAFGAKRHQDDRKVCNWPFDGPGGTLAHAFFPPDGRIHFDEDEHFTTKSPEGINYMWVATHELGHILGLQHDTVNTDAVMYPYYRAYDPKGMHLHPNDIRRIQDLYPTSHPVTVPPTKAKTKAPTKATTVTKLVTTTQTCSDALMGNQCPDHKKYCKGYSRSWTDYMRKYCAKTCGYCTGGAGPCPPSCKDRHHRCGEFVKRCKGYSDGWTDFMRRNCRRTCRYCCLPA